MNILHAIIAWFSGGPHQYHRLTMCMQYDYFWIAVTVVLDVLVAVGYIIIAYHWSKNEKSLPPSPARLALRTMRNIFVFCGICGYVFVPVKMFWPAWRLYDFFMVGLVFYTWRYALNVGNFKVIYTAIGRSGQLAEDLARSQEESKRKSFFLNAISHDLRTPLNGMLLHANLAELQMISNDPASVQHSLNEIKTCVRFTADLLEGLLEFARLESGSDLAVASQFDLKELIEDVIGSHALQASTKSLILENAATGTVMLQTDRLRLERIMNNLVSNAIKFTETGSIRVEVQCTARNAEIRVIDTGIGIAVENQARLFEEFFQVENHERDRRKGFGLGLAISSRLARQLGGELQFQSTPGRGSRFCVVLPLALPTGRIQSAPSDRQFQHAEINGHAASAVG